MLASSSSKVLSVLKANGVHGIQHTPRGENVPEFTDLSTGCPEVREILRRGGIVGWYVDCVSTRNDDDVLEWMVFVAPWGRYNDPDSSPFNFYLQPVF